jgi:hypothetical protein
MLTLNFIPAAISVKAVIGASVAFSLTAKHADGTDFDLSGYTVTAPFTGPAPVSAFTVTPVGTSTVTLAVTPAECAALGAAYLNVPLVWPWACWLASADASERIELVRGGLVLHAA